MNSLRRAPKNSPLAASPRRQRGSAALEFALVLPLLLLLVGGVVTFAEALTAKSLLIDIAANAARACVMKGQSSSQVQACANNAVPYLITTLHPKVCMDSAVTTQVTANPYPVAAGVGGSPTLYLLTVKLGCPWTFLPLMNLTAQTSMGQSMNLTAIATMPFLSI